MLYLVNFDFLIELFNTPLKYNFLNIYQTKILFAVLNWGLGHASRSIPIIHKLIQQNNIIHIASAGDALLMLRAEFPNLPFIVLPDYQVNYNSKYLFINVISQYFKVKKSIEIENQRVQDYVDLNYLDIIISDNAFGAYHVSKRSILITHQLRLMVPPKLSFLSPFVQMFYKKYFKPFSEIWVPDSLDSNNLSGRLSHDISMQKPLKYIGIHSRFLAFNVSENNEIKYDFLFIISGPEPSRTNFEHIILNLSGELKGKIALVRGKFDALNNIENESVTVFNFLDSHKLMDVINQSNIIICRSGYSSLMDLMALGRKAFIVPTPGQTEQEYLANFHRNKEYFISVTESELSARLLNSSLSNVSI